MTVIDHLVELRRRFTVSLVAMALGVGGAGPRDDSPSACPTQVTQEQPGEIKCTEQCAKVWPPLLLEADISAAERVSDVPSTFGVIVRPDETRQLTYDDHALYTFMGDRPGEALRQGVDGWYVFPIQ